MPQVIEIYAYWNRYGWYAASKGSCYATCYCSGPKVAAEELAKNHFGARKYLLTKGRSRVHYLARELELT